MARGLARSKRSRKLTDTVGGGGELVLSVSDVCSWLEGYETIVDKFSELYTEHRGGMFTEEDGSAKLSELVTRILVEHKKLVELVESTFGYQSSSPGSAEEDELIDNTPEIEALIQSLKTHLELLDNLGLLKTERQRARCDKMLSILEQRDSLIIHAAKSSERLQLVELRDFNGLLDEISEILALARHVTGQDARFQTLTDLKSLVTELEILHAGFEAAVGATNSGHGGHQESSEADPEQVNSSKSMEILNFMRDSTRFIADCRVALGMTTEPPDTGSHSSNINTVEVLTCIQELMQVLHHFDAFQPASSSTVSPLGSQPAADRSRPTTSSSPPATSVDSNSSVIQEKVAAVLTFFDELHLMTDFAQNILDEECDDGAASTTNSQSNTSSSVSLGMLQALTRTPTPISSGFNGDNEHGEPLEIEVPFPLDELELELQAQQQPSDQEDEDQQGFFAADDDGSQPAIPIAESPLAESLMDISLVMNDHHRIISEAAHWVHKTTKLRQRRRSSKLRSIDAVGSHPPPRSSDLGSEICRLVREHCALLSLAKQLFKLKDPRHDLSSLLECLAILKRLTTRLPVFQTELLSQSQSSHSNSGSSASLASNSSSLLGTASNTGSQDSLQTSLSVFTCIEDIARHLQDYDFFLAQMRANSDKQWLSKDATREVLNIEVLTRELNTRLELLTDTQSALGLQNPVLELPEFVQSVQELVVKTESLEPWKTTELIDESAEVQDGDLDSDCGRSEATEAHTKADTSGSGPGIGLEAYANAFDKIESDLTTYTALMSWLRGVLPFSQSVESVNDLKERVVDVLSQLEVFANENVAMKDEIAGFQAEKERTMQQIALEDAFLADHGVVVQSECSEASASSSRLEIFRQLLDEQRRLATKTGEVEASNSLEANFLVQSGLLRAPNVDVEPRLSTHMRLEIYKKLLLKTQQRGEATRNLEMLLEEQAQRTNEMLGDKDRALQELKSAVGQADHDERAFLSEHEDVLAALRPGDDDDDDNNGTMRDAVELQVVSRVPVFEKFVSKIARLQASKRIFDIESGEERAVLQKLGLLAAAGDDELRSPCDAEAGSAPGGDGGDARGEDGGDVEIATEADNDSTENGGDAAVTAHESVITPSPPISLARRLALYKELAELQALVRVEKAAVEQEKTFLEANKLAFDTSEPSLSRMSVYRTLLDGQNALIDEKMEREVEMGKERGFLESHGVDFSTRMDVLEAFVKLRDEIAERNQADAMEQAFLLENKLWIPEAFESKGDDPYKRMDAQEHFGVRFQVFSEFLETIGANEHAKQQREAAVEAEKAYLLVNTSLDASNLQVDGPQHSRLHIYETLLAAQREADARREADQSQQLERFPSHEDAFLRSNGLESVLDTSEPEPASVLRARVYEELFGQIRQRDETIAELSAQIQKHEVSLAAWDEVALKHADTIARAEWEKQELLTTIADRDTLITRLKDEFTQDRAAEVENHAAEVAALAEKHAENVKQLTVARDEKVAGFLASSKLELAAALEKQAKQLEFLVLVRAGEENLFAGSNGSSSSSSSALSPAQARALLLDKVTKRDSSAISMIYRSIRLATDILNTFAFTGSSSSSSSASSEMIPVEVTQAVLNCVKELKALKEFLIDSLEQLTRGDDAFPSQPPAFLKANIDAVVASGDKEAAIDFALCSHREFMAFAHLELLKHQNSTDAGISKLLAALKAVAGGSGGNGGDAFTVAETTFMELEMQLTTEKEARENADCKFKLNDEYYQRLLSERKDVEATLTKALSELRDECRALRMKVDTLEQERYAAPGSSSSVSMFGLSPSPRATPMTPSGGFGTGGMVMPIRPEKPREPPRTINKGAGSVHKERFVSDLEKETGQRRSTNTTRRINEWKKQDAMSFSSSSSQLERDFRAMETSSSLAAMNAYAGYAGTGTGAQAGKTSPTYPKGGRGLETAGGEGASTRAPTAQDQELWYQGVRMVHHISFFVSMFYVQKQHLFRVEVFNSDTEQQQTVYVTWSEMQTFLDESKKAMRQNLALDDPSKHADIADILFERVRVYGEGPSNVLLGFE